jgi:hypothetical protein
MPSRVPELAMKVSIQPIRAPAYDVPAPPLWAERPPAQAGLVVLATGISCLFADQPAAATCRARVAAADAVLPRPIVIAALPLAAGGLRHVVLVGEDAAAVRRRRLDLVVSGRAVARLDPDWLQSPLRAATDLTAGLAPAGQRKFARLLLTCGGPLFAASGATDELLALLGRLAVPVLSRSTWRATGARAGVLSAAAPAGLVDEITTVVLLTGGKVRTLPRQDAVVERGERGAVIHLPLPSRPREAAVLAMLAPEPFLIAMPGGAPRALLPWLDRRPRVFAQAIRRRLKAAAADDKVAASLLHEMDHGPTAVDVTLVALARTRSGLLLAMEGAGSVARPAAARVEMHDRAEEIPWPDGQAAVAAWLPLTDPLDAKDAVRVSLAMRSGHRTTLYEGPVEPFGAAHQEALLSLPDRVAVPAIASVLLDGGLSAGAGETEMVGIPPEKPILALVVRYGSEETLHALYAALCTEPKAARVEIIVVAPVGEGATAARTALEACSAIYGHGARLVVVPAELDVSRRLAVALRARRASGALLLGEDVLPSGPRWLARWLRAGAGAFAGAALVASDGSVLHAGGVLAHAASGPTFRLRSEGLPQVDLPRRRRAVTALLSADCAGLGAGAIDAYLTAAHRCGDPDVLLSWLAQRAGGLVQTRLDARFVRYRPAEADATLRQAARARALARLLAGDEEGPLPCAS